jgi:uncharacterized membrane protein
MSSSALLALTTVALVGSAVVGGVFFAFSTFVMKALDRLPPRESIAAMQAINVAAPTAWFMTVLFGTAMVCVAVAVAALVNWGDPGATYQLVGSALSLAPVLLTGAYHVPRNNALATVDPDAVDAGHIWHAYSTAWTAWNHVRTVAPIAGAVLLAVGLRFA